MTDETRLPGTCECGCGRFTRLAKQSSARDRSTIGKPLRFIHGHNGVRTLDPDVRARRIRERKALRRWVLGSEVHLEKGRKRSLDFKRVDPAWCHFVSRLGRYHITLDQFHAKYEAQDFGCGVCGDEMTGRDLHIDHDHRAGSFRGVLCNFCNVGLGSFKDNPTRLTAAIRYLMTRCQQTAPTTPLPTLPTPTKLS